MRVFITGKDISSLELKPLDRIVNNGIDKYGDELVVGTGFSSAHRMIAHELDRIDISYRVVIPFDLEVVRGDALKWALLLRRGGIMGVTVRTIPGYIGFVSSFFDNLVVLGTKRDALAIKFTSMGKGVLIAGTR